VKRSLNGTEVFEHGVIDEENIRKRALASTREERTGSRHLFNQIKNEMLALLRPLSRAAKIKIKVGRIQPSMTTRP
jgi:hypothetical protein